jgi:hypothetical protein
MMAGNVVGPTARRWMMLSLIAATAGPINELEDSTLSSFDGEVDVGAGWSDGDPTAPCEGLLGREELLSSDGVRKWPDFVWSFEFREGAASSFEDIMAL